MELLTISETARLLKAGRSTVYQPAERGALPVVRIPGSSLVRIDGEALREQLRGQAGSTTTPTDA